MFRTNCFGPVYSVALIIGGVAAAAAAAPPPPPPPPPPAVALVPLDADIRDVASTVTLFASTRTELRLHALIILQL